MSANRDQHELPSVSSSLLLQVQRMEPDAWARLVDVFSPIVYRWSRRAGLNQADSADVVQDVFIAVARNISRFERQNEKASFRSWLATITRNRVRDQFRRLGKTPAALGGTENLQNFQSVVDQASESIPEDDLEKSISLADLDHRVPARVLEIVRRECDERTWMAFWQTTALGDSAADVAARMEMNVASVYQAKSRILRRLRKKMDELP